MSGPLPHLDPLHRALRAGLFLVGWLLSDPVGASAAEPSKTGEDLARMACVSCHIFPEPDLLPRKIWNDFVLPKMGFYMGILQLDPEKNQGVEAMKASGLFPTNAMIPKADFDRIADYYLQNSPELPLPQPPKPEITVGLKQFVMEKPRFRRDPPVTTLVSIDPVEQKIYAADAMVQGLEILGSDTEFLASIPVGNIPVALTKTPRGFYLVCIGHFFPNEDRRGQLIFLEKNADGFNRKVLLSNLPRACDLQFGDFNRDGKMDFALCMFGYLTGRFSWFENAGDDTYEEHLLINKAGAIKSVAHDFTGDGVPDLAVLMGQELETLLILENDGKGQFTKTRVVFTKPPSYGHSGFELVDFNKDGRMDFLVTNGDNGDYESPPKAYHGIRIYLDDGKGSYTESFFYPMHGAFKAVARDFDQDGDLDIAAVSFFPDYKNGPRESFVYLENLGGLTFRASTFRECIAGRWLTLDVGDVDGDGDLDIVLGSLTRMPTEVPPFLKDLWAKSGPSVLLLKNTLR